MGPGIQAFDDLKIQGFEDWNMYMESLEIQRIQRFKDLDIEKFGKSTDMMI